MRNTILVLGTVASLPFATLTPALATGVCSNYPSLDNCPIYGVYDKTSHGSPSRGYGASYQVAPEHIRQSRHYSSSYHHHG